jgi:hypothetical protein
VPQDEEVIVEEALERWGGEGAGGLGAGGAADEAPGPEGEEEPPSPSGGRLMWKLSEPGGGGWAFDGASAPWGAPAACGAPSGA